MYQPLAIRFGKALLTSADLGIPRSPMPNRRVWPIGGWRGAVKRPIDIVFALLRLDRRLAFPCW